MQEIERKFLISPDKIPVLSHETIHNSLHIEQFYIQIDPEIRFRKVVIGYTECRHYYKTEKTKTNDPIVRWEKEEKITEDEYYDNYPRHIGNVIIKRRYMIQLKDKYWCSVDVYNDELCIAEVEFKNIEEAKAWIPPEWFGEEVTGVKEYKNVNIATKRGELK